MALPNQTDAMRALALEKATAMRHARAQLRDQIKAGDITFAEILERADDPTVARLKVSHLIESLPGYGKVKAAKLMEELEISPSRRIQGLGKRQRDDLMKRLG